MLFRCIRVFIAVKYFQCYYTVIIIIIKSFCFIRDGPFNIQGGGSWDFDLRQVISFLFVQVLFQKLP